MLLSIAMYDNRKVDFWPLSIHPKGTGSDPASATPAFPLADCPARLRASLNPATAEKVKPATWGDSGGLWFGELKGNTVWLGCRQVGAETVVMVGAAGPEADSTKGAVDLLVGLVSR